MHRLLSTKKSGHGLGNQEWIWRFSCSKEERKRQLRQSPTESGLRKSFSCQFEALSERGRHQILCRCLTAAFRPEYGHSLAHEICTSAHEDQRLRSAFPFGSLCQGKRNVQGRLDIGGIVDPGLSPAGTGAEVEIAGSEFLFRQGARDFRVCESIVQCDIICADIRRGTSGI